MVPVNEPVGEERLGAEEVGRRREDDRGVGILVRPPECAQDVAQQETQEDRGREVNAEVEQHQAHGRERQPRDLKEQVRREKARRRKRRVVVDAVAVRYGGAERNSPFRRVP